VGVIHYYGRKSAVNQGSASGDELVLAGGLEVAEVERVVLFRGDVRVGYGCAGVYRLHHVGSPAADREEGDTKRIDLGQAAAGYGGLGVTSGR